MAFKIFYFNRFFSGFSFVTLLIFLLLKNVNVGLEENFHKR